MSKPKTPPHTHRRELNTTVAPATLAQLEADRRPGEGLGRVLDRWADRLADRPPPRKT